MSQGPGPDLKKIQMGAVNGYAGDQRTIRRSIMGSEWKISKIFLGFLIVVVALPGPTSGLECAEVILLYTLLTICFV